MNLIINEVFLEKELLKLINFNKLININLLNQDATLRRKLMFQFFLKRILGVIYAQLYNYKNYI